MWRGACKKMILINKAYIVKNDDEGGGGSEITKKWWRLLWTAPKDLKYIKVFYKQLLITRVNDLGHGESDKDYLNSGRL